MQTSTKIFLFSSVFVALLSTSYLAEEIYVNLTAATEIQHQITYVQKHQQLQNQALRSQQKQSKDTNDLPLKSVSPNTVPDPYSIELEALGIKLKIVNESTWTAVFKLCFLWSFILVSILVYRRFL